MARQDWWNKGRNVQELRGSKGLDIIEQLSRIGSTMAGRVKQRKQTRGRTLQRQISDIIGEGGSKYKRLIDNKDVVPILEAVKNMSNKVSRSDEETISIRNFVENDIKQHIKDNSQFKIDRDYVFGLEDELANLVTKYYKSQATTNPELLNTDEIKEHLKTYLNAKDRFINYFPGRTKNAPNLVLY